MRLWAGTLRRRLALAMMASAGLAVTIGLIGIILFYTVQEWFWRRSLPADVVAAIDGAERGQLPSPEVLARVVLHARSLESQTPMFEIGASLLCAVIGMGCAVLLSLNLSRKLGAPIESVSTAAAAVANGDLTTRVVVGVDEPEEIERLQLNFNQLVNALAAAERQLRDTNAAIAHELRTPLTVLRLRLQAIVDGVTPAEDAELGRLIGQVDLLTRLVEDLRTLSLATAGRLELSCTLTDLAKEVDEVAAAMAPTLQIAGVSLHLDLRPALALVDPLRVKQCVQALLSNVGRHASCGGEVLVETRLVDQRAQIVVSDRGPGFDPFEATAALTPFWRAEGSRSRDLGGSGLGLAVVEAVATTHGGRVIISARSGGGARIAIDFPV